MKMEEIKFKKEKFIKNENKDVDSKNAPKDKDIRNIPHRHLLANKPVGKYCYD